MVDVERPAINREEGSTAAFSKAQARKLLDAPPADTLAGLRDRAILSVGLQVGFRRAEIAALNVGDLHQNRGFDALRVIRKGGRREALAINPQAAQRIRAYLEIAGHGDQLDAPLFRPLRGNAKPLDAAGRMDPDAIDRMVRKYVAGDRPGARLLGALDARDLHHHGAGERRAARGRAESGRASRPIDDQALRPARIQSRESRELFCNLLITRPAHVLDGADCSSLIELCNFKDKRELEKFCRTLTIRQTDFVLFILCAQSGGLAPYRYASHFEDRQIPHLIPSDDERAALAANGLGPLQGHARKALTKMSQLLRDRRHLSAHLFYTADHAFWHLFYFDQRDIAARGNHWEHGAHLHYASDVRINADAGTIWNQIRAGKQRFPTIHIRFTTRSGGHIAKPKAAVAS